MADEQIPGFKFDPTDEELVSCFLVPKLQGQVPDSINEVNLYQHDPWELPVLAQEQSTTLWHFFSQLENKHKRGGRVNRSTRSGNWKPTGKDRDIISSTGMKIGTKKSLVFYSGSMKTDWVMHEYSSCFAHPNQNCYVVCKLINKEE